MRVLKPGGSIFVNLGDCYSSKTKGSGGTGKSGLMKDGRPESGRATADDVNGRAKYEPRKFDMGVRTKSLVGTPWRYAIRCIDELGLILRAEIVWAKPNGLPESVTDRVRRSHEQVFHFVKQPRYFSAVDEVREPHSEHFKRYAPTGMGGAQDGRDSSQSPRLSAAMAVNPLGKLPGSVWSIPTAPLTVPDHLGIDHFAAYPPELVRRIVLGWSPREVCTACGEGRRPVTSRRADLDGWHDREAVAKFRKQSELTEDDLRRVGASGMQQYRDAKAGGSRGYQLVDHATALAIDRIFGGWANRVIGAMTGSATITGYACVCPDTAAPTTPGVVLDPFGGTGTTALVADMFGRVGISVDLSADYCRLAQWRCTDPGERARALDVDKPPVQVDGQLGMFDDLQAPAKPSGGLAYAEKRGRNCANCGYRTQYAGPTCDRCGTEKSA